MIESHSTALIRKASIEELCGHRNRALELFERATEFAASANAAAKLAAPGAAYIGGAFVSMSGSSRGNTAALDEWRRSIDRDCWRNLLQASGLGKIMGAKQMAEFERSLDSDPPPFTVETAYATFAEKTAAAGAIFTESVVNAFNEAPKDFKSNDAFHVGARMVFEYAYSPTWGGWIHSSYGRDRRQIIRDLDRIMHILDAKPHETDATDIAAVAMRENERNGGPNTCETAYFRFRWFKKGTMHVWFLRDDLVRKMNRIIADHYGATLGDAA